MGDAKRQSTGKPRIPPRIDDPPAKHCQSGLDGFVALGHWGGQSAFLVFRNETAVTATLHGGGALVGDFQDALANTLIRHDRECDRREGRCGQ
jgi:hypothetical protein